MKIQNFLQKYRHAWQKVNVKLLTINYESFHLHFNQKFYKSLPNLSILLKILVENFQSDSYTKINSVNLNIPNTPKNKSNFLKYTMTKKVITDFKNKLISRYSYTSLFKRLKIFINTIHCEWIQYDNL